MYTTSTMYTVVYSTWGIQVHTTITEVYGVLYVSMRVSSNTRYHVLHAFDDMKTHDLMYSDYMIMVISSTSPDPLETMGITTYAIRSTHALHGTYIIG